MSTLVRNGHVIYPYALSDSHQYIAIACSRIIFPMHITELDSL